MASARSKRFGSALLGSGCTLSATSSTKLSLANLQRFELLAQLVSLGFELIRNRVGSFSKFERRGGEGQRCV